MSHNNDLVILAFSMKYIVGLNSSPEFQLILDHYYLEHSSSFSSLWIVFIELPSLLKN